jgi:hypothetical protein
MSYQLSAVSPQQKTHEIKGQADRFIRKSVISGWTLTKSFFNNNRGGEGLHNRKRLAKGSCQTKGLTLLLGSG